MDVSWTMKKAECQRIDAFELWCWRRLLRVPWTARRSNQSILKEINPEYSLEGRMLKLKLQHFGHLVWRADSGSFLDPDAGKDWRQEKKGTIEDEMAGWHHWLDGRESDWTPGDIPLFFKIPFSVWFWDTCGFCGQWTFPIAMVFLTEVFLT